MDLDGLADLSTGPAWVDDLEVVAPHSAIVDLPTTAVIDGQLLKVLA